MNDTVLDITNNAIKITVLLASPMLIGAVVMGVLVSIFQAVTQINEQTLAFIPKILVIVGAMVLFSPWMMDTIINFTQELFIGIPEFVKSQ